MDLESAIHAGIDAAIAGAAARLSRPRSCVVVLRNDSGRTWTLAAVTARRGNFGQYPPATIAPRSFVVFSAQSRAAHAGAGCDGTVRYESGGGAVELHFDVPYAGRALARIRLSGNAGAELIAGVRAGAGHARVPILATVAPAVLDRHFARLPERSVHLMSSHVNTGADGNETPQSVVGPITLAHVQPPRHGAPAQPNSVVGPITLGVTTGPGNVTLDDIACGANDVVLTVSHDGTSSTITIDGVSAANPPALAPGTLFHSIARTESEVVVMYVEANRNGFWPIPCGAGNVTITTAPAT